MGSPDSVAKGRYVIHREIARGGMATVHLGHLLGPAGFTKLVAIKQMRAAVNDASEFVAMFLDEAWLAARIQHPNVVATLDVVADHQGLFIVMEYIAGTALSGALKAARAAGQQVDFSVALAIASHMLAGLHAAHETRDEDGQSLHVVHRDISPQNVLVGTDGLARIVDFGVAKASTRLHVTHGDALKGKLAYMAPEQVACDTTLDRRGDVFAASIVIWEMLAGQRLFAGGDFDEVVGAVLTKPIPRLSELRADIPPAFDEVLAKGLARDRDERYATADQLALALEPLGRPASPRAVSEWVRTLCETDLAQRETFVREVERGGGSRSAGSPQIFLEGTLPGVAQGSRTGMSEAVTRPAPVTAAKDPKEDEPTPFGTAQLSPHGRVAPRRTFAWVAFAGVAALAATTTVAFALHRPSEAARSLAPPPSHPAVTLALASSAPSAAVSAAKPLELTSSASAGDRAAGSAKARTSNRASAPARTPPRPAAAPTPTGPAWGF